MAPPSHRSALRPPGLRPLAVPDGRALAVVTDLDRTFTDERLALVPEAIEQARSLRRRGVHMVLATGRCAAEVPWAELDGAFDGMVLEGGAVWGRPGAWAVADVPPGFWGAAAAARAGGFAVRQASASFSVPAASWTLLAGHPGNICLNADRLDVTPPGVDKATGVSRLLAALGVPCPWMLAVGDGQNDLPLAALADHFVAVANADAALAAVAHESAPHATHAGFLWAVGRLALPSSPRSRATPVPEVGSA